MNFSSADRRELGRAAGEDFQLLRVGLVVGVDLDGQLARRGAFVRGDDPEIGAALVDDPLAVAGDAGAANAVVLVEGDLLRLDAGLPPRPAERRRAAGGRCWPACRGSR